MGQKVECMHTLASRIVTGFYRITTCLSVCDWIASTPATPSAATMQLCELELKLRHLNGLRANGT